MDSTGILSFSLLNMLLAVASPHPEPQSPKTRSPQYSLSSKVTGSFGPYQRQVSSSSRGFTWLGTASIAHEMPSGGKRAEAKALRQKAARITDVSRKPEQLRSSRFCCYNSRHPKTVASYVYPGVNRKRLVFQHLCCQQSPWTCRRFVSLPGDLGV